MALGTRASPARPKPALLLSVLPYKRWRYGPPPVVPLPPLGRNRNNLPKTLYAISLYFFIIPKFWSENYSFLFHHFTKLFLSIQNMANTRKNPRTVCVSKTYKCTRHAHWREMFMRRYKHSRELSNAGNLVWTTTTRSGNRTTTTWYEVRCWVAEELYPASFPGGKYTHDTDLSHHQLLLSSNFVINNAKEPERDQRYTLRTLKTIKSILPKRSGKWGGNVTEPSARQVVPGGPSLGIIK